MGQFTLGTGIAKATFIVYLRGEEQVTSGQFDNNESGIKKLKQRLRKRRVTRLHACLEVTGRYEDKMTK